MSGDAPVSIERYALAIAHLIDATDQTDALASIDLTVEAFARADAHWTAALEESAGRSDHDLAARFASAFVEARRRGVPPSRRADLLFGTVALAAPPIAKPDLPFDPSSEPRPPPAPPRPLTVLHSGTVVLSGEPLPEPATPFELSAPDGSGVSLAQYARLCAELVAWPDRRATLERHRLDAVSHDALDEHWRRRMREEPALGPLFHRAYSDELRAISREPEPDAPAPVVEPVKLQSTPPPPSLRVWPAPPARLGSIIPTAEVVPPPPVVPSPPEPLAPAPPAPVPSPPPPAATLIEAAAQVAASLALAEEAGAAQVLEKNGLTQSSWTEIDRRWQDAIAEETERGKGAMMKVFDSAYVAQIEKLRGPVTVDEYARIVVAEERKTLDPVLSELRLVGASVMRIRRTWIGKIATNAALGLSLRRAIERERDG